MEGVNSCTMFGTVGNNPEVKEINSGSKPTKVAKFSLATNRSYKDSGGERKTDTQWHNIEVWGVQADIAERFVTKGSQVIIEGELRYDEYESKEGQKVKRAKVHARRMTLAGGTRSGSNSSGDAEAGKAVYSYKNEGGATAQQSVTNTPAPAETFSSNDFSSTDDDLPF